MKLYSITHVEMHQVLSSYLRGKNNVPDGVSTASCIKTQNTRVDFILTVAEDGESDEDLMRQHEELFPSPSSRV